MLDRSACACTSTCLHLPLSRPPCRPLEQAACAEEDQGNRQGCTEARLQRLRWVAATIADHGGCKYTGADEGCPLVHALETTKKQLDGLDADMAALDSELDRARLCLQVSPRAGSCW